jgi:hypothetical protein
MSMYTQILDAALREHAQPDGAMTTGEALSVLRDCRDHLGATASSEPGMDWSAAALANQVAHDIALIDLARCVGLDADPHTFDQPERRRGELRRELTARGIGLDELDHQANSGSRRH